MENENPIKLSLFWVKHQVDSVFAYYNQYASYVVDEKQFLYLYFISNSRAI